MSIDKKKIRDLLGDAMEDGDLLLDEPMSEHTTFGVGGPAAVFASPHDADQVRAVIEAARAANAEWYVMGRGSDLLVADTGLDAVVVHIGENMAEVRVEGSVVIAQAGATNKQVADAALSAGLAGYEFASGIPGSVGGAAIMNAGAYNGEFRDVCEAVECLTPEGEVVEVAAAKADWGYRHSMMGDRGYVVLGARIRLVPWDRDQIRERMADLKRRREEKQPLELGSAGSTFKRPVGYYAGKLIDDAGMRGHRVGGAGVSEKHAGFVVNNGGATAAEVRQVISDVQKAVFSDSGVHLEPEVRMWGFDD